MMIVKNISREQTGSGARLRATIECKGTSLDGAELWFRYPNEYYEYLSENAYPWIAALLHPAMRIGTALKVEAPASPVLLEGTEKFMEIMHGWSDTYTPVAIHTEGVVETPSNGQAIGAFFSGGVDSFYTILKNQNSGLPQERKISHLIFVRGFDLDLQDDELYGLVSENILGASRELGITLVACSTNIREVVPGKLAQWDMYFGQALASVALGLEKLWKAVYIPAGLAYSGLIPHGSHPLLDPLWSTESTRIIHDGADATRIDKVASQIAQSPVALEHLRVCWENRHALKCDPKLIRAIKKSLSPWRALRRKGVRGLLWSGAVKIAKPIDRVLLGGKLRRRYRGR